MSPKTAIILNPKRAQERVNEVRAEYNTIKSIINEKEGRFRSLERAAREQNKKIVYLNSALKTGERTEKDMKIGVYFLIALYVKTEITAMQISKLYIALSKNKLAEAPERKSAQKLAEDYKRIALNYRDKHIINSRRS